MTASTTDGEARLTTFKDLLESRANAMGEDIERGQRFKRPIPGVKPGMLLRIRRLLRRDTPGQDVHEELHTSRFRRNSKDQEILGDYNKIQFRVQRSFAKAATNARPGTLLLEDFYGTKPRLKQLYADEMATMLAARAESDGRAYLSGSEGKRIADALERTGRTLLWAGLPHLAEEAFDQAANIHARFKDPRAEDRCEFQKSRAHGRTFLWWKPMRLIQALSGSLFGYGYKPLRLLIWIAVVIAAFTLYMLHLPRDPQATRGDAFFMAIQNFVNPMGLGDAKLISPHWQHVLEVETYTGDILRNIFFVLLIRKWFRL